LSIVNVFELILQIAKATYEKAYIWMANGAAFLLLVDPKNKNFLVYDKSTWKIGERAQPLPPDVNDICPCPQRFPGLHINLDFIRRMFY
jgi:hypothetical protein